MIREDRGGGQAFVFVKDLEPPEMVRLCVLACWHRHASTIVVTVLSWFLSTNLFQHDHCIGAALCRHGSWEVLVKTPDKCFNLRLDLTWV